MPADLLILRSVQIINSNVRDFLEKRETSFISEYAPNDTVTGHLNIMLIGMKLIFC